jgi:hypothetical protein
MSPIPQQTLVTDTPNIGPRCQGGDQEKITKHIAVFVEQWQRDTVYDMVPKLLRMIERLGPHSLSYSCKLALSFLQICCKKSDIP